MCVCVVLVVLEHVAIMQDRLPAVSAVAAGGVQREAEYHFLLSHIVPEVDNVLKDGLNNDPVSFFRCFACVLGVFWVCLCLFFCLCVCVFMIFIFIPRTKRFFE